MIKDLVLDEAVLSTPCEPATAEDAPVAQDLIDTLASIDDAACLAANQIGVTKAICVYQDDKDRVHVMYNPKIMMALGGGKVYESCLNPRGARPRDALCQDQGLLRRARRR